MTKIPCGGFYIDDETLGINEDGKLSVIGGGGGGGSSGKFIITFTYNYVTETYSCDKTYNEILAAAGGVEDFNSNLIEAQIFDSPANSWYAGCERLDSQAGHNGVLGFFFCGIDTQSNVLYSLIMKIYDDDSVAEGDIIEYSLTRAT